MDEERPPIGAKVRVVEPYNRHGIGTVTGYDGFIQVTFPDGYQDGFRAHHIVEVLRPDYNPQEGV